MTATVLVFWDEDAFKLALTFWPKKFALMPRFSSASCSVFPSAEVVLMAAVVATGFRFANRF